MSPCALMRRLERQLVAGMAFQVYDACMLQQRHAERIRKREGRWTESGGTAGRTFRLDNCSLTPWWPSQRSKQDKMRERVEGAGSLGPLFGSLSLGTLHLHDPRTSKQLGCSINCSVPFVAEHSSLLAIGRTAGSPGTPLGFTASLVMGCNLLERELGGTAQT